MQAIALGATGGDIDDAAQAAAKVGAVGTGSERQLLNKLRVYRRAQAAEVIDARDEDPIGVDPRIGGRRAPHHQLTGAKRRAGDTGQVLNGADGIVLTPGRALDLSRRERGLDELAADRRSADDGFKWAGAGGDVVDHLQALVAQLLGEHGGDDARAF